MDATITVKMTPLEFDFLRKALESAIQQELQLQENIRDEVTDERGIVRVGGNKEYEASQQREATFELILSKLS